MKKIIIANWKMNPQSAKEAISLFDQVIKAAARLKNLDLIFCPPFVWLGVISEKLKKIKKILPAAGRIFLGAQDIFWQSRGAFTGEISGPMLKNLDCQYVIIGHSERRWIIGETNEIVNKKFLAALNFGLIPILAVGEKERKKDFLDFLKNQLEESIKDVSKEAKFIIAYEPVWAIGTGLPDRPEDTELAVNFIKKIAGENLILYGGSVTSKNIKSFLEKAGVDGALVGGASLDAKEFAKILKIANL
ncbi:MAG: triose-phosphate isomerase [Parcubacteria group bacterium]|nr:triose-phosphate isomerase [Parcubacteria group bacterium]